LYFPRDALLVEVDSKTLVTALLASSTSFLVSKESELVGFSRRVKYLLL